MVSMIKKIGVMSVELLRDIYFLYDSWLQPL
jgi:hypothetical protein